MLKGVFFTFSKDPIWHNNRKAASMPFVYPYPPLRFSTGDAVVRRVLQYWPGSPAELWMVKEKRRRDKRSPMSVQVQMNYKAAHYILPSSGLEPRNSHHHYLGRIIRGIPHEIFCHWFLLLSERKKAPTLCKLQNIGAVVIALIMFYISSSFG